MCGKPLFSGVAGLCVPLPSNVTVRVSSRRVSAYGNDIREQLRKQLF
jgi:hypothetical protein